MVSHTSCSPCPRKSCFLHSSAYIREYEKQNKKEINRIQFRDKAGNWQQYHVRKHFTDGSSISHMNREDMFMRIFVGDFALNEACYNCPHARFPRVGDITLGDFWGDLQQRHPEWPITNGISSILGNSSKGKRTLHKLVNAKTIVLTKAEIRELIDGQPYTYLSKQEQAPQLRRYTLNALKRLTLSTLHHSLFDCIHYGPFRFPKGSMLHRIYTKLHQIKHRIIN